MAGTETPPVAPRSAAEFVDALEAAFRDAARLTGTVRRHFRIAGRTVRLAFAGDALVGALTAALRHVEAAPSSPDLTVLIWDALSTGSTPGAPKWLDGGRYGNSEIRPPEASPHAPSVQVGFDGLLGMLSAYDPGRRAAFCWLRDTGHIPITIAGTPLRVVFQW